MQFTVIIIVFFFHFKISVKRPRRSISFSSSSWETSGIILKSQEKFFVKKRNSIVFLQYRTHAVSSEKEREHEGKDQDVDEIFVTRTLLWFLVPNFHDHLPASVFADSCWGKVLDHFSWGSLSWVRLFLSTGWWLPFLLTQGRVTGAPTEQDGPASRPGERGDIYKALSGDSIAPDFETHRNPTALIIYTSAFRDLNRGCASADNRILPTWWQFFLLHSLQNLSDYIHLDSQNGWLFFFFCQYRLVGRDYKANQVRYNDLEKTDIPRKLSGEKFLKMIWRSKGKADLDLAWTDQNKDK